MAHNENSSDSTNSDTVSAPSSIKDIDSMSPVSFASDETQRNESFVSPLTLPDSASCDEDDGERGWNIYTEQMVCPYRACIYNAVHFHCINCTYAFTELDSFDQHVSRHVHLEKLMGGEFKMFNACNNTTPPHGSEYSSNAFAFHCTKCSFICYDSAKIVPHRRKHMMSRKVLRYDFRKVFYYELCSKDSTGLSPCNRNLRTTHYHCVGCSAIVKRLQLNTHKSRCRSLRKSNFVRIMEMP